MQLLQHQASTGGCVSSRARVFRFAVVSRPRSALKAPAELVKRLNHHLVAEPSLFKPGPTDYEFYITPKPVTAHLKQSQVGAVIGVVSVVQTIYTEVAQAGFGSLLAAGVVVAGALALSQWWTPPKKPATGFTTQTTQSSEPLTTSPVKDNDSDHNGLASVPLPPNPVLAHYAPSTKALMVDKPPCWSAPPAAEELPPCPPATKPAAREPTAAAAAAGSTLTDEEAAIMAAQLASNAYPWLSTPAFVGFSVSLQAPGLFETKNLSMKDRAGINSTTNVAHLEAGRKKLSQFLDRASNTTLGLPRLDVPVGSSVEVVFNQKWESLLLHAVTPEDWAGDRAATWADMRVLAAYGVPLAGEVQEGRAAAAVVSGVAAEAPTVAESVGSATASAGVAVPRSGAVVGAQQAVAAAQQAVVAAQQAVNAAKKLSVRQIGLKKLMGAVKATLTLMVAAVTASGFRDLF